MVISQTPLRISMVGGGTDLKAFYQKSSGAVISSAIDKFIYVIVKKRFDDLIVLHYTENEICNKVDDIKHDLIREAMKKTGVDRSVEIITLGDIPSQGSGLGSSSSVTVGLLNALYNYQGFSASNEKLARDACDIEINILGKPIGKQDQYIAAYGGLKKFIFNPDDTVDVMDFSLEEDDLLKLGSNILLHFTNQTRSADKILSKQNRNIDNRLKELSSIKDLVSLFENGIKKRNFDILGELLKINWGNKKKLADGITKPEIESMVSLALDNGAAGCKIAGAGGGGFLLSYVPREKQDAFRKAMDCYRELPFMMFRYGSRIVFNIN